MTTMLTELYDALKAVLGWPDLRDVATKNELKAGLAEVRRGIAAAKADLMRWMASALVVNAVLVLGAYVRPSQAAGALTMLVRLGLPHPTGARLKR